MLGRLKTSLHHQVRGFKTVKPNKSSGKEADLSNMDNETCSAPDTDLKQYRESNNLINDNDFRVLFELESFVDCSFSPTYFCVCIGDKGEPFNLKKCRGLDVSKVFDTRSMRFGEKRASALFPLSGLSAPEISIRFFRSIILGQDGFLGDCHILVDMTSTDPGQEYSAHRLIGGGNCFVSCRARIVNSRLADRSNILPNEPRINDSDRRNALVASVWKCLESTSENDPEFVSKRLWLRSLLEVLESEDLNYLLVRIPIASLMDVLQLSKSGMPSILSRENMNVESRGRFIKAIQMNGHSNHAESAVASLFLTCPNIDLCNLMRFLNRGGGKNNLFSLIFSFIQSDLLREQLLLHIQNANSGDELHILTEVDPIVHASLISTRRWPGRAAPGALALFRALSNDVTFVSNTQRPFESRVRKLLRDTGFEDFPMIHCAGSGPDGRRLNRENPDSESDCFKYSSWWKYRRLFPNRRFLWIGTSVDSAKAILSQDMNRALSQQIGIARVVLALVILPEDTNDVELYAADPGLMVCRNFVQAAIACINEGLLRDLRCLKHLVKELLVEFTEMHARVKDDGRRNRYLNAQLDELNHDLEKLREYVKQIEVRSLIIHDDMVDSIVLTPIEAQSPSFTDRSAGTDPDDFCAITKPSISVSDITLRGL